MKIRKSTQYMYQNTVVKKNVDFLLIGEGEKNVMFLLKISVHSCLMIYYIVEENIFVCNCLQAFIKEILKRHTKDRFKINGKQMIKMTKKGEYVTFKSKITIHGLRRF